MSTFILRTTKTGLATVVRCPQICARRPTAPGRMVRTALVGSNAPSALSHSILCPSLTIPSRRWLSNQRTRQNVSSAALAATAPPTTHSSESISLSYVKGPTDVPLLETTIGATFDQQVAKYGQELAVVVSHENVRLTYAELGQQVDQVARALYDHGLRHGDRLGVFMPNNLAWMVLQYATSKLGVILTTINPGYRLQELEHALNLVECKALVLTPTFLTSNYISMTQELFPELRNCEPGDLQSARVPSLKSIFVVENPLDPSTTEWRSVPGYIDYHSLLSTPVSADSASTLSNPAIQPSDVINIQFTSGTTGSPKAAALTHRNILNNGYLVGKGLGYTPQDRLCCPVPLYHCVGLVLGNLGCMTHGAAVVFPSMVFNAEETLKAIEKEKCTSLYGVPTMFIDEMAHPDIVKYDLSSLRTGIMAGSPCPIEVMKEALVKLHMNEVLIAYGMTETSPVSFITNRVDSLEKRVATVGQALPHVEAKVVHPETREILTLGQEGELCTRGFGVMAQYWNDPESTSKSIDQDGWMYTGDLAAFDQEGYCRIVGRTKDMIIRGGENISPVEIENFLFKHPKVENILVVGVPDKKFGEQVCACVIPTNAQDPFTVEEIRDFCQGKLAHFKIPKYAITMETFPKTVTGKIKRNDLRDIATEQLGLRS
ncbi:hypothetical protein IWQ62_004118 [Dispira parvispora]|uniref:Uncharacterized protein n=1 Tax=Dispira parvispora TaxID=1520584 RepID=A0A9W8APN7_9FUNG|nr:hypothetical protein IWQ62_004118 [Dispira parvispora]